jgi:hypothetical protein
VILSGIPFSFPFVANILATNSVVSKYLGDFIGDYFTVVTATKSVRQV